ncbi:ERV/ALR sulfhydryl oxidase domain-containing protein [Trichophaea hybrida]|nr:ERV/ALR sulfhydryl oxidase domain-containing protein [Trichophaea hybrida]
MKFTPTMRSRLAVIATITSIFIFLSYVLLPSSSTPTASPPPPLAGDTSPLHASPKLLTGEAIMPHLGNETIKAELGRAAWKLLHTTLARYPKLPTPDEREALNSYLHLFARLYPCGECAAHFRLLIQKYPPQTSTRDAASQWGCFVHNVVNERLKKKAFDCGEVTEVYKCGCAEADKEKDMKDAKKGIGDGKVLTAVVEEEGKKKKDKLEENARKAGKGKRVEIERAP